LDSEDGDVNVLLCAPHAATASDTTRTAEQDSARRILQPVSHNGRKSAVQVARQTYETLRRIDPARTEELPNGAPADERGVSRL
jgi:hypothetical protein